ncbi:hypothetical protein EV426DRAFT_718966 [Tirmania nivea]|nr:hypothetical protein EV426DRAFT_718966 [Tirmania nivea]
MSSSINTSIPSPSSEAAETDSPSCTVFTRGRTRRKMLRGAEKKEEKKKKEKKKSKQKKTGPPEGAAPATQTPIPLAEAALTNTTKKKRQRLRKPKQPTRPIPSKTPRRFQFEDKIIRIIPRKRAFQEIIDLTGFNSMGRATKIRRNDKYIPDFLPDGNEEHEVNKDWEEWVKRKFVKLCYPREFTPGPMLELDSCVPLANHNNSVLDVSASDAPTKGSDNAEAWETSITKQMSCPAGCACWDCFPTSSKWDTTSRQQAQALSNTKSSQGSSQTESLSSQSDDYEFIVPGGTCTWASKIVSVVPAKKTLEARQKDITEVSERHSATLSRDKFLASPSRDNSDTASLSRSGSSRLSIDSRVRKAREELQQAQSREVQRLRQLELVAETRKTIQVSQKITEAIAYAKASRMALLARASRQPVKEMQEGHSTKLWERTREVMKEKGLFPTGAPHPPLWTKYVAPENVKRTNPNDWWTLNPEALALDPMYAEKIGKILMKFPEVRKWRGVLPPYPVPGKHLTLQGAQYVIPNIHELPKKVLLDYVQFEQQGDIRFRGRSSIKVGYDSELLLLYMEVWNRRCAIRERVLWSMGMATTVGWAGGLMKIENIEDVKKLYPSLAPETVKWCALLAKGFCRMPLVVGMKPDVWHNPRYDNPEDRSAWPERASGAWASDLSPKRAHATTSLGSTGRLTVEDSPPPMPKVRMVLRPKSFYQW